MIEGKAAGMSLWPATQAAVQQIALPNVVKRILERQRSCSIHLSKADATSQAVKRLHAGNADGRAMVEQQEQRAAHDPKKVDRVQQHLQCHCPSDG